MLNILTKVDTNNHQFKIKHTHGLIPAGRISNIPNTDQVGELIENEDMYVYIYIYSKLY